MNYYLKLDDEFREIDIEPENGLLQIRYGEKTYRVDLQKLDEKRYSFLINNRSFVVEINQSARETEVFYRQERRIYQVLNRARKIESEIFGGGEDHLAAGDVRAPMPGMVLRIEVAAGETVEPGQPLMVIEAMKMENEIRAAVAGVVQEILVSTKQAVEKDDLLIRISDG